MNYLVDTNILLRLADRNHSQYPIIRKAIRLLRSQGHDLYITPQNCAEFWNVATRPSDKNGLGFDIEKTAKLLRLYERLFPVIPDNPDIYPEWKRLVKDFQVKGVQVHDARLVAAMKTHGLNHILTFNVKDFKRYQVEGIKAVSPQGDIKQGTMQQLLTGKKRLPGFSGEWEEKTLGDIGVCIIGLTYKPENIKESGLLVLRSSNIENNKLIYKDNVYVDVKVPEKLIAKEGDILICVRNGSRNLIGKSALIDKQAEGSTFGAFMSMYRTIYSNYIFQVFQTDEIKKQINANMGATINQITNKDLKSFQILLPTLPEQKAIAEILSDMDAEIEALEQKRDKYKAIKQGMMQELLTGKTRLVDN